MAAFLLVESPLRIVSMACRIFGVVKPSTAPLEAILGSSKMCMMSFIDSECGGGECCDAAVLQVEAIAT